MEEDRKLEQKIDQRILETVPRMIQSSITTHTHMGGDSQVLTGQSIANAPQNPLTSASLNSLSTGGPNNLSAADSAILTNAIQRIADIESVLRTLGFISS